MSDRTAALYANKSAVWVAIASLVVALLLPILTTQRVNAAQVLDRYIAMQSSAASAETDYNVSFQLPTGVTVGSFRIELCNENPLPGLACDSSTIEGDNTPDLGDDAGSVITITNFAIADTPGDTTNNAASCTVGSLATDHTTATGNPDFTYLDVTCNAAETTSVTETGPGTTTDTEYVNFTINDVNNPSNTTSGNNNDPFYARIYTFSATTPTAYNQTTPPLGNYEGGVALSTAEQITVSARVQEVLVFEVGVDDEADDCAVIAGNAVDLGVLDSTSVNLASTDGVAATPNTDVACAEVTTNAANGVSIYYVGDNLAVGSTSCADADTDVATNDVVTDQCINRSADGDVNVIAAGAEQWGMGISANINLGTTTNNLTSAAAYDVDTANEYSFVPNAVTQIASSTTVVDQEALEIDMGATASITTPTGVYDTTLTFIATATF